LSNEIKALQSEIAKTQSEFIGGKMRNALLTAQDERLQRESKHAQMHERRALGIPQDSDDEVRTVV
jgi:hypothetical protein